MQIKFQVKRKNVVDEDEYNNALRLIVNRGIVYTTLLQTEMKIGYLRARRIMEKMEADGFIRPPVGSKPGIVFISNIEESGRLNSYPNRRALLLERLKTAIGQTNDIEKKRQWQDEHDRHTALDRARKVEETHPSKVIIWDRLEKWQKNSVYILLALLCVALLLWATKDSRNNFEWEGDDGVVNIFPIDAESKNYRLTAYIKVDIKPSGWFGFGQNKSYDVDYVFWPNGGKTYFEECEVIPTRNVNECLDNDFREWRVEVQKEPEYPYSGT